ncbi:MAG: efflux RND transporter permease subunit [Treponema sp.]|jgi:multidrug efflux pump subunit AcrB|nr:efflux RND transporter permease subunit [Treponema sp.]
MKGGGPGKSPAGTWLERPAAALCILLAAGALSLAVLAGRENVPLRETGSPGFTLIFRHYGVDVREMERTVAIPLEDTLSTVKGVKHILSSSENGQVRVFVTLEGDLSGTYEAISDAVQRVYESLPPSVQRPEILSSDDTRIPIWTAAVFDAEPAGGREGPSGGRVSEGEAEVPALGTLLERVIKPALEGLEGVGEVEISGVGLPEMVISLKSEEAAARGLNASIIAGFLGRNDLLLPAGTLRYGERELLVMVDGRYPDAASLAGAYLPQSIRLGDVARIYERDREPDTLSRLDGKKTAVISVMAGSGADLGALSRRIQGELEKFSNLPLELRILSDRGAEEAAALGSVFEAALQGAAAVALTTALLGSGRRTSPGKGSAGKGPAVPRKGRSLGPALICACMVPFICILSAALLVLLGFSLNRVILAGLSAGVGAAVDAAILCSEGLKDVFSPEGGRAALKKLWPTLISGSVTTIAALFPLTFRDIPAADISPLAWAVGTVTLVSLITALILLPPLLLRSAGMGIPGHLRFPRPPDRGGAKKPGKSRKSFPFRIPLSRISLFRIRRCFRYLGRRCSRIGARLLAANVIFCINRPGLSLFPAALITAGGIGALVFTGADVGTVPSENSLYARVEFEGGFLAEEADRLLAAYGEELTREEGIISVQTSARTGSGSILISLDPQKIKADQVRNLAREKRIPGAFVYIPEASVGEQIWEITLSGDDDNICRTLAEEAARLAASLPLVRETVLNFKTGGPGLTLMPDRERLQEGGFSFAEVADTVRRGVHGPVAYKRIGPRGETDVRVQGRGGEALSREETGGLLITGRGEGGAIRSLRLDMVTDKREDPEPSSIRREDRRRVVSLSIRTKSMDPRDVRDQVMGLLGTMELPRGYTMVFDPEAIRNAEALSGMTGFFLLALLFCAMVIAAANESFGIPLAVLSVVPPSLAVPALFMAAGGYPLNAAAACAFVAVSGMAVNASVLSADGIRHLQKQRGRGSARDFYRVLRNRIPPLLAITLTTVAGAVPFLFLQESSNVIVRNLSLVTALGVGSSAIFSVTMLPGLAKISPLFFDSFEAPPIPGR